MTKIKWVASAWAIGLITFYFSFKLVGVDDDIGFGMSLFASLICGAFTSVGTCTIIGYLKAIPAEFIGGWSSGSGIAGITGSCTYLLLKSLDFPFDKVA